jgi:hypothetical protein
MSFDQLHSQKFLPENGRRSMRFRGFVPLRDGNMQQAEEEHPEQEQDGDRRHQS